jgi:hypothetical protein
MSSDQGISSSTNNTNTGFQPVRQNSDNIGHAFENQMQMFAMKQQQQQQQQPMTSPITGTIYSGPPAKYLNNNNGYMRPMLPPQKYVAYNGSSMQQRRQNNNGVDNATNDSVK